LDQDQLVWVDQVGGLSKAAVDLEEYSCGLEDGKYLETNQSSPC